MSYTYNILFKENEKNVKNGRIKKNVRTFEVRTFLSKIDSILYQFFL